MITDIYTVPFAELKRVVGSKDAALLEAVLGECGGMLRDSDGYADEGATVTCADALKDLIDGVDFRRHPPPYRYRYRCAVEALWAYLGEYLGQVWVKTGAEVDDALAARDIPLRYGDLVHGDELLPLPDYNDLPFVGSWSPGELAAALPAFRRSGVEPLPWEEDGDYEDIGEVLGLLCHFAEEAAGRPGWGLVAFSY